jgi:prepilin-type N-terminal cleavage/methylation domain-containing protein
MLKQNPSRLYGFTLVEVLIVLAVVAIMAATVLPQFTAANDPSHLKLE